MSEMFNISNNNPQHQYGEAIVELKGETTVEQIENLVKGNQYILFMKGTPVFPQCGFSARAVGMLNSLQKPFKTFDILSNQDIRQGLKEYANWPTFPQMWVSGSLVGGSDIMVELYESGELKNMII